MMPETFGEAFQIPGAAFTITVAFLAAFMVSMKASVGWQVGIVLFFTLYLTDPESEPLARMWVYAGWAGYLSEKLGLWYGLVAVVNRIRSHMESITSESPSRATSNPAHHDHPPDDRDEAYRQANSEYARRERQRQQETTRRAKEKAEQVRRQAEKQKQKTAEKMEDFFRKEREKQASPATDPPPKTEPLPKADPLPQGVPSPGKTPSPKSPPVREGYWFEVLGVPSSASWPEIRKAYYGKVKQYHPDKLQNLPEAERKEAEEGLKIINDAYKTAKKRRG